MITIFFIIFFTLSLGLNVLLGFGIFNALRTTESYEAYFEEVKNRIEKVLEHMKAVDTRGSFESDDEVGSVFTELKAAVDSLDVFLIGETSEEKNTKEEDTSQ